MGLNICIGFSGCVFSNVYGVSTWMFFFESITILTFVALLEGDFIARGQTGSGE